MSTGKFKLLNGVEVEMTQAEVDEQTKSDTQLFNEAILSLRTKRNRLLAETDYLALSDQTLSDDMKTYRQNLRDLPAGKDTVEKCDNATFPTKP